MRVDHTEYKRHLDEALGKAFAAKGPKVRLAYMDLAEFYERQVRRSCGVLSSAVPVHFL